MARATRCTPDERQVELYDRLAAGKALMVTRPRNPSAQIDTSGYLSDCEWLAADTTGDIVNVVYDLTQDGEAEQRPAAWVERYFGTPAQGSRRSDSTPPSST
jgi:hypothetical protein